MRVETEVSLFGVEKTQDGTRIHYRDGRGGERVEKADYIYLATGRKLVLGGLGLEKVGGPCFS